MLDPDQAATMSFSFCSSPAHSGQAHQSCVMCQSQIDVCVCVSQATDGSSAVLCGLQPSELFKKSNGFEHLVTCASSAHPSLLSGGCTQRLLTWMAEVLTAPQALQLGSGKDALIFVLLLFTLQWCSALPDKDQDCFKSLE